MIPPDSRTAQRIYCDHNATTTLHPAARAAMQSACETGAMNPSSLHYEGRVARQLVEKARHEVAALLSATPSELTFTSGATESNNTLLAGLARAAGETGTDRGRSGDRRVRIVASRIEHPSVMGPLAALAAQGAEVIWLGVDEQGRLALDEVEAALRAAPTDVLVVGWVNHELGNVAPMGELSRLAHAHGALLFCDAAQGLGRIPASVQALGIDALSGSAHKLGGPTGVGVMYVRGTTNQPQQAERDAVLRRLPALMQGGTQERGKRPGTENVLGIVGFGAAATAARSEGLLRWEQVRGLRQTLEQALLALPGARLSGAADGQARAPGTLNIAFAGVPGDVLFMNLDLRGIAVSTGSACSSGSTKPSPVLLALGQTPAQAREAVRISLGPNNEAEDLPRLVKAVSESLEIIRRAEKGGG